MDSDVGESSSSNVNSSSNGGGDKAVIVRVKRKLSQSPLEALWVEIKERPLKRPFLDFQNLSISSSKQEEDSEGKCVKRVLVQHLHTLPSSQDSLSFLQSFLQPSAQGDCRFKSTSKERHHNLYNHNKHDHLLSKARQHHLEVAKTARFEQIWKSRTPCDKSAPPDALDGVCRVYDILRVDTDDTPKTPEKHEDISAEDQALLTKFLPLLKEHTPDVAQEIESDLSNQFSKQGLVGEYVYDLYAVKEQVDDTEDASYPFPLVQVDDEDELYDGLDDLDYATDDSNAEDHPGNDYPEEESSEEKSETSDFGSEDDDESGTESDTCLKSDESLCVERSEDPFYDYEMDDSDDGSHYKYSDDAGGESD